MTPCIELLNYVIIIFLLDFQCKFYRIIFNSFSSYNFSICVIYPREHNKNINQFISLCFSNKTEISDIFLRLLILSEKQIYLQIWLKNKASCQNMELAFFLLENFVPCKNNFYYWGSKSQNSFKVEREVFKEPKYSFSVLTELNECLSPSIHNLQSQMSQ